ncbi:DNA repair protein RecO [Thalassovita taeanensis]|uniref:DNA repair protein RecO n=1 Tax=Thalassovita taeanensis TaxID=657014 RepID=A0A1H9B296_9RHOB|nr:DNA repair protein RecO [Thalassovita taeanensis]SEP82979.1 DNA replication and repair protein RecO [Thalassovita taeanensis]
MEWRDEGILLGIRRHGESAAILELFTPSRGRHVGVLRGATSRKIAPILQPGAQLSVSWRARLEDHIGSFTVEPLRSRSAIVMSDRQALEGMSAVTSLLIHALPEREAHLSLYRRTEALLDILDEYSVWPLAYLRWELALLEELGYGLDLSRCAVTGVNERLDFVSPRSGRAVSAEGAGEWVDRLLPLPPCFLGGTEAPDSEVAAGLVTTGHFLRQHLTDQTGQRPFPGARQRFVDGLSRRGGLAQRQHQIDQ